MIVRDFNEAKGTNRQVGTSQWNSVRLLLRGDNMGFSFHITTIYAGEEVHMHYKNHFEAVYCISGKGSIEDLATGEVHQISPGVMYALDKHDRHILRAESELILTCTFNPPLHGTEVHDETGAYPEEAEAI